MPDFARSAPLHLELRYYIPDQRPEEVWLFKQYDTREDDLGRARCSDTQLTYHENYVPRNVYSWSEKKLGFAR